MPFVAATGDIVLQSVLIATDFSAASDKPLRHALAIARHYGAKFYMAHVVSSLGFALAGPDAVAAATQAVWRDAQRLESDLVHRGALAGLRHEVIIRQGSSVWEELEKTIQRERVELVVLGTHARRGFGKLLLGSVAEQIFRQASCLVLTVGPGSLQDSPVGSARAIRPFLFATDFSASSLRALPYAISAANHFGTRLVLLHVVPDARMPEGSVLPMPSDAAEAQEKSVRASLRRLKELVSTGPKLVVEPEYVVELGPVSEKILQTASALKADTIILGLHHKRHIGADSHLPWATAYEVVCDAGCSVLTVRS